MRRILLVVLAALAVTALAGCNEDAARVTSTPVDDRRTAPEFTLPGLDGGEVSLAEYRGTPVVLNFWASWCEPCRKEMPALADFAREQAGKIAVVGVAVNDRPEDSRAFAKEVGADFDLAIDRDADVAGEFGVTGLPVTVVIDAEGRIVTTIFGEVDADDLSDVATTV